MQWKYVKPLKDTSVIKEVERELNYQFPICFIECVKEANGGFPVKSTFDTTKNREMVLHHLLSFNKSDKTNIIDMNVDGDNLDTTRYVMFAIDVSGNPICFDRLSNKIIIIYHETGDVEEIAADFVGFLSKLY